MSWPFPKPPARPGPASSPSLQNSQPEVALSGNFPLGLQGRRHSEQDQQYGEQTHGNLDFNQGEMCNLTPSGPNGKTIYIVGAISPQFVC